MVNFDINTRVWVSHSEKGWATGVVLSQANDEVRVKIDYSEEEFYYHPDSIMLFNNVNEEYDDMVKIDDLNEPIMLHNLKKRFEKDKIYTLIGTVLVSVNPFKELGLYSNEMISKYKGKDFGDLPPHIYQIATSAFRNLLRNQKSQAILVSGESGAGKTEAAKSILSCLAHISSHSHGGLGKIEEMILETNPVLEAFGNARTVRNNNSSRFGKFIQIHFDPKGKIIGAHIDTYLLEKSRIVFQATNERNYHIFYQLLSSLTREERDNLSLSRNSTPLEPKDFHYLRQSGCFKIPNVDDRQGFTAVKLALKTIGLSQEQQSKIFQMLAAILHLGNIQFGQVPKGNAGFTLKIHNATLVPIIAKFLGVPANSLEQMLLTRNFKGAARGSIYILPLEMEQAIEVRDALAKAIYERLFFWLVDRINDHLTSNMNTNNNNKNNNNNNNNNIKNNNGISSRGRANAASNINSTKSNENIIGVLDIFGFEIFETNSLEQLLINFANEKLQSQFNRMMFQVELEEYKREGVVLSEEINYIDNQYCVDLIERKPFGILPLLDEECQMPKGADAKFLEKILGQYATNTQNNKSQNCSVIETNRKDQTSFILWHYAGKVAYSTTNFLDKNKDTLPADLENLMETSTSPFIAELFPSSILAQSGRKRSVSMSFSLQLSSLIQILDEMTSHYIRCIKPNQDSKSDLFDPLHTLNQLRCAGLMDTIRVRKMGYGNRRTFQQFVDRYGCLIPLLSHSSRPKNVKIDYRAECIFYMNEFTKIFPGIFTVNNGQTGGEGWVIGHSKLFMKDKQIKALEDAREGNLKSSVLVIELLFRKSLRRKKWRKVCTLLLKQHAEEQRRKREEEEKRKKEEEERKRREEVERKRKEEEEKRRNEEELRRLEEKKKRDEEIKRRAEEEKKRQEDERRKRAEEEKKKQEEEKKVLDVRARTETVSDPSKPSSKRAGIHNMALYSPTKNSDSTPPAVNNAPPLESTTNNNNSSVEVKSNSPNSNRPLPQRRAVPLFVPLGNSANNSPIAPTSPPSNMASNSPPTTSLPAPPITPTNSANPQNVARVSGNNNFPRGAPMTRGPLLGSASPRGAPRTRGIYQPKESFEKLLEGQAGQLSQNLTVRPLPSINSGSPDRARGTLRRGNPRGSGRGDGPPGPGSTHNPSPNVPLPTPIETLPPPKPLSNNSPAPVKEVTNNTPVINVPITPVEPETADRNRTNTTWNLNLHRENILSGEGTELAGRGKANARGVGIGIGRRVGRMGVSDGIRRSIEMRKSRELKKSQELQAKASEAPAGDTPIGSEEKPQSDSIEIVKVNEEIQITPEVKNEPILALDSTGGDTQRASGEIGMNRGRGSGVGNLNRGVRRGMRGDNRTSGGRGSGEFRGEMRGRGGEMRGGDRGTRGRGEGRGEGRGVRNSRGEMRGRGGGPGPEGQRTLRKNSKPPPLNRRMDESLATIIAMQIPKLNFDFEGVDISKEEIHRRKVIYELLKTEKDYIDDVFLLVEIFFKPLIKSQILKTPVVNSIFSNVESLVRINIQILKQVLSYSDSYVETHDLPIGQIFFQMSSQFKSYSTYCINQPKAFQLLEELQESNPQFLAFIKNCENDRRCRGLQLLSFLIKPTQRVMKYPLLFKDIVNHTKPEHSDYNNLVESLKLITEVVDYINEQKREVEIAQEMQVLQNSIEGIDFNLTEDPDRKFFKEYTLQVTFKPKEKPLEMSVFLFTDVVVIGKKKKKLKKNENSYEYRKKVDLTNSKFIVVAEAKGENIYSFELLEEGEEAIRFSGQNPEEISVITQFLKPIINTYNRKKLFNS